MKSKEISIPGFTYDLTPNDRPSISIFGEEGTGKTRLACTMPPLVGYLAIDKKAKRTAERVAAEMGLTGKILINEDPFMTDEEMIEVAKLDEKDYDQSKKIYTKVCDRIFDAGMVLAGHTAVESIAVDTTSQFFDYILFAHHGRKTKIDPKTGRGAPNQYMIDFINALRSKNLMLIHRSKEIWKDTGEVDANGRKIQAPSSKFKADGFSQMGGFVMATIELVNKKTGRLKTEDKFRCKVITCQTNSGLEGEDLHEYGVSGEDITWTNLLTAIGCEA